MGKKVIAICLLAAVIFSGCGGNKAAETMATDTTPKVETVEPEKTLTKIEPEQAEQPEEVETVDPKAEQAEQKPIKESEKTLDYFVEAFESAGYAVQDVGKPYYSMINALDGVIFNIGEPGVDENATAVKIYQYKNKKDMEKAIKDFPMMEEWAINGLFIYEMHEDENIKEFFLSIE